ncbi:MAG: SCP-like extracellular protein [Candidatus Taylorbacteria bacterium]|nr:SCP-like extracellular protein [Candidatus Taylorbacteria bacterium]
MKNKCSNLLFIAALFGLTLAGFSQTNQAAIVVAPTPGREASRLLFNAVYCSYPGITLDWTGNYTNGTAGTISSNSQNASLARVNVVRVMAGLSNIITFNASSNAACQQAALMMSANNFATHFPPTNSLFYTASGANAAALGNITLGIWGPDAISAYMTEGLANNFNVFHRRWMLYPQTLVMGVGDVPALGTYKGANVLLRSDENIFGPRPSTRYGFVAWPPPGYVPYQLVPPRWSLSYPNAVFSTNSIQMIRNGTNVPVRIETIQTGAGENSIVWVPDNIDASSSASARYLMPKPSGDNSITVTVSNVMINGSPQTFTYAVTIFDPEIAGADRVLPNFIAGSNTNVIVGIAASLSFVPVPLATGYEWRSGKLRPYAYIESGESSSLTNITVQASPGYSVVTNNSGHQDQIDGTNSFHLACPDGQLHQTITLKRFVIPSATSQLTFLSRFAKSTSSQSAVILVSQDEGNTWSELYRQTGTGGDFDYEFNFANRSIDFSAFAGKTIMIRFDYQCAQGGSFFPLTTQDYGWWIDKIAVVAASEMFEATTGVAPSGTNGTSMTLNLPTTGSWAAQIRAQVFNLSGSFHAEWGQPIALNAMPGPPRMNPPTLPGNGKIRLSFMAETGHKYNLEYKTNLTQISWASLATNLSGTNVTVAFDDLMIAGKNRFYRINQTQ